MDIELKNKILKQQKNEITEYKIYKSLSESTKDKKNKKILSEIAKDELDHYNFWKSITKKDVKENKLKVFYYTKISKFLGLSFGLKLLEKGEENAQEFYKEIAKDFPKATKIQEDEHRHEKELIEILNDQKLNYASAIVLGLNDALVELTGSLAGLTLALQNSKIIATSGLIIGLAASLSMAASGYLSSREENNKEKNPITSALYTGFAYIITVLFLVSPYFIFNNIYLSLGFMLIIALSIIFLYTYYMSVAKEVSLKKRFLEMATISMGVAIISFLFGLLIKKLFGI